jgi:hypothetical protein
MRKGLGSVLTGSWQNLANHRLTRRLSLQGTVRLFQVFLLSTLSLSSQMSLSMVESFSFRLNSENSTLLNLARGGSNVLCVGVMTMRAHTTRDALLFIWHMRVNWLSMDTLRVTLLAHMSLQRLQAIETPKSPATSKQLTRRETTPLLDVEGSNAGTTEEVEEVREGADPSKGEGMQMTKVNH